MNARYQAAAAYAKTGWPVFPVRWTNEAGACSCDTADCHSPGKHPMTRNGLHDATTDPDQLAAWWMRWPDANVAIATGAPGPDVVDFDVKDGAPGRDSFNKLKEAALLAGAFALVATWSGGWHLYFPGTEQGNGSVRGHGVDFRGKGGYVLAPPSRIKGLSYEVLEHRSPSWDAVRPVSFDQLRARLAPRPVPRMPYTGQAAPTADYESLARWVANLEPGNRNQGLYWAARRAFASGATNEVANALYVAACQAGLSHAESSATIRSARRAAP